MRRFSRSIKSVLELKIRARLRNFLTLVLGVAFFLSVPANSEIHEYRFALVVSFADYSTAFGGEPSDITSLHLTEADGDKMETALELAGFSVERIRDGSVSGLTPEQSRQVYLRFLQKVRAHAPNAVAFVYFSGHGASTLENGEVFLLPPTVNYLSNSDIERHGWPVSDLIDGLRTSKAGFVVVDACRNTPFGVGRAIGKGLERVRTQNGVLVAYATEPGGIAPDDGLYASELSKAISQPGATSFSAFEIARLRTARHRVSRAQSAGSDAEYSVALPWVESSLLNHIKFVPGETAPESTVSTSIQGLGTVVEEMPNIATNSELDRTSNACDSVANSRQNKLCHANTFWKAIDEDRFADAYYMMSSEAAAAQGSITMFRQVMFSHKMKRGPISLRLCFDTPNALDFRSRTVAQINCTVTASGGSFSEDIVLEKVDEASPWSIAAVFVGEAQPMGSTTR